MNRFAHHGVVSVLAILLGVAVLLLGAMALFCFGVASSRLDAEAVRQASFRSLAKFNASYLRRTHVAQKEYLSELRSFAAKYGDYDYSEYIRTTEAEAEK